MTYPTAIPDLSDGAVNVAGGHGKVRDALAAVMAELGIDPSGSAATVKARLDAAALTIQDENVTVSTGVTQIDFQGAGVTAGSTAGEIIVTIPGGGGAGGTAYPPVGGVPKTDLTTALQATLTHAEEVRVAFRATTFANGVAGDVLTRGADGKIGLEPAPTGSGPGTGPISLDQVAGGTILRVDKARGSFGALAGNWPATRPSSRTDIFFEFVGNTDPGTALMIGGDTWVIEA